MSRGTISALFISGLVLVVSFANHWRADAQMAPGSQPPYLVQALPLMKDKVCLNLSNVVVPNQSSTVLLTAPANRWFVLTSFRMFGGSTVVNPNRYPVVDAQGSQIWFLDPSMWGLLDLVTGSPVVFGENSTDSFSNISNNAGSLVEYRYSPEGGIALNPGAKLALHFDDLGIFSSWISGVHIDTSCQILGYYTDR